MLTPEGMKGLLIGALIEALKKFLSAVLAMALALAAAVLFSRLARVAGTAVFVSACSYFVWWIVRR